MTFEELGALGELVGAIAWIVLLAYIAIQIRHSSKMLELNTRATEAATRQAFTAQDQAYLCSALDSSVLAVAVSKLESGEKLSPLELSQLFGRQHVNFRVFESAFSQHRRGVLDEAEWERYRRIIAFLMRATTQLRFGSAGSHDMLASVPSGQAGSSTGCTLGVIRTSDGGPRWQRKTASPGTGSRRQFRLYP